MVYLPIIKRIIIIIVVVVVVVVGIVSTINNNVAGNVMEMDVGTVHIVVRIVLGMDGGTVVIVVIWFHILIFTYVFGFDGLTSRFYFGLYAS